MTTRAGDERLTDNVLQHRSMYKAAHTLAPWLFSLDGVTVGSRLLLLPSVAGNDDGAIDTTSPKVSEGPVLCLVSALYLERSDQESNALLESFLDNIMRGKGCDLRLWDDSVSSDSTAVKATIGIPIYLPLSVWPLGVMTLDLGIANQLYNNYALSALEELLSASTTECRINALSCGFSEYIRWRARLCRKQECVTDRRMVLGRRALGLAGERSAKEALLLLVRAESDRLLQALQPFRLWLSDLCQTDAEWAALPASLGAVVADKQWRCKHALELLRIDNHRVIVCKAPQRRRGFRAAFKFTESRQLPDHSALVACFYWHHRAVLEDYAGELDAIAASKARRVILWTGIETDAHDLANWSKIGATCRLWNDWQSVLMLTAPNSNSLSDKQIKALHAVLAFDNEEWDSFVNTQNNH